jgi:hypothetical protein
MPAEAGGQKAPGEDTGPHLEVITMLPILLIIDLFWWLR